LQNSPLWGAATLKLPNLRIFKGFCNINLRIFVYFMEINLRIFNIIRIFALRKYLTPFGKFSIEVQKFEGFQAL